ncbi:immunoglobulin lambda-1 light chain-like isoform X1 [Sceloporus undulatus]|uniref:immunoglobulin lambda-1 light chain-like isoform X1 n=1 Tax=Sceloporus undulatus TaxID=8520 RepID=UPI001C4BE0A7|nr:immunoglobulin lambda-1 light chain-like isoform X1 [Sceloporus undulatus]
MLLVPVISLLGLFVLGSESQLAVTQPPSLSKSLGSEVKIPCTMNSGYSISKERARWYQQKSGGVPLFLYHYYTSSSQGRGSGVPERFSVSPDASNNLWNLVIAGVQAEDEADYYCATWDYLLSGFVFGGGTHLTVTGQNPVHPSVFLFPPSQEEIKTKSKATLVCLMDEFHPGVIQVEWKADGTTISSGVETTKPLKQGNKYVASSYLTLSESDWKSHNKYACKVTHESKTIEKEVNRSECS